jgi:NADPH2:quinone reductase
MSEMKAVWYERQGAAQEVLTYGEMPTPTPGPGEVRVRLRASAVNPADANRRAGRLHAMEFPRIIPNSDGAGVIDAVGNGVGAQRVGERVWVYFGQRGRAFGTAAQYICLPEELACPLPDHISDEEGACLGIPGLTAFCELFDSGPIDVAVVLFTAGAGAVSH